MTIRSSEPKKRSSSNLVLIVPVLLLASAAAGWSGYWYFASRKAQTALAAWTQREAQAGRSWICPDQKVGGFPFVVQISCTNAGFQGEVLDRKLIGTLREFRAEAPIDQPDALRAELGPPFVAKTTDGSVDLMVHWEQLSFEFEGKPDALGRAAILGQKVILRGTVAGVDLGQSEIGRLNAYAVRRPDRPDNAYEFYLGLKETSLPSVLSEHVDFARASVLAVGGTISQADFGGQGPLLDQVEKWRNANGKIDLTTARFVSADQKFEGTGTLDLDDEHRVRGELDTEFANLTGLLQQLGFDPMLVTAGSFLSDLVGGSPTRVKGELLGGGRLHLPLAFSDGWLSIGAIRTPVRLPPLY